MAFHTQSERNVHNLFNNVSHTDNFLYEGEKRKPIPYNARVLLHGNVPRTVYFLHEGENHNHMHNARALLHRNATHTSRTSILHVKVRHIWDIHNVRDLFPCNALHISYSLRESVNYIYCIAFSPFLSFLNFKNHSSNSWLAVPVISIEMFHATVASFMLRFIAPI